jgi:hypothetical protein
MSAPPNVDSGAEKRAAARPSDQQACSRPAKVRPVEWTPYCNAPDRVQKRFRKQLDRAHREPQVAIKLFCIECMGYEEAEPKHCPSTACPLYALNRRIFCSGEDEGQQ